MEIYKNEEWRQRILEEGTKWVAEGKFTIFATANYYDGKCVSKEQAMRDAVHYFNMLDRRVLKRIDYNNGVRLERMVFVETGRSRKNTHLHFYIKGIDEETEWKIKEICRHLWSKKIRKGFNLSISDNRSANGRLDAYCWKEQKDLNNEVLAVGSCYLN